MIESTRLKSHEQFKTIGVLGGMGPQATISLPQRLIAAMDAHDDAAHIPLIVDMNPQVPSRLDWLLENKGEDPGPTLVKMARRLEVAGAQALVMPCNTAHHFAPKIEEAVDIPLIHMMNSSAINAARLCEQNAQVGILASPATEKINLFSNALSPYNLRTLYPPDQTDLLEAIRRIKSSGPSDSDVDALSENAQKLEQLGAQCILVGCSEFSIVAEAIQVKIPVIDTLSVLINDILEFSVA